MTAARKKAPRPPATRSGAAPEKNSTLLKNAGEAKPRYKPTNAGKGRVKGVPNAVTKTAREIFSAFIEGNAAKVQELWERVARKNPAKALAIYAKVAEFVVPKLQRTELSGHVTGGVAVTYPAMLDMSAVDAARAYQELLGNPNIKFEPPRERALVTAPPAAPRPAPAQDFLPAPAPEPTQHRPPRRESAREEVVEAAAANVVVLEPLRDQHEHRPIADSKCAWCRQMWVNQ